MLTFPNIDPVIFGIGPVQVRWYGLMYVLGFSASYYLVQHQIKKFQLKDLAANFENLNLVLIISLVLGGRLGYVLFYNFSYYASNPAEIMATWQGGMSFHGALLGVIIGGLIFCKRKKLGFWLPADIYVVTVPIGLGLGRLGNFINGELYGRVTEVPWAMAFPGGGPEPRHPSQLYECFLEGLVLFILLWLLKNKRWPSGYMLAFFLIFYGVFRMLVEQFRQPDVQIGFLAFGLTMGQVLSLLMVLTGAVIMISRRGHK